MAQAIGSKQRDIKMANLRLILSALRQYGMLSRSELSERLSISAPSISKNVEDLLQRNVLLEHGTVVTNVGRRPNMLGINPDFCCVAVVDFSRVEIMVAIADMKAELIDQTTISSGDKITHYQIQQTIDALKQLLARNGQTERLQAISIATPGIINPANGNFLYAPRFVDYENVNLNTMFSEAFDTAILMKNDINMATLGEALFGAGKGIANQLYVYVDHGLGAGLILDQKLYEGSRGIAGEVGTWLTDPHEMYLRYRSKDYSNLSVFDREISGHAIRQKVMKRLEAGEKSILSSLAEDADRLTFSQIVRAYHMNDPLCREVVEESAIKFACMLKNLIDFLDVDIVVIGGAVSQFGDGYLDVVKEFLSMVQPIILPKLVWSELQSEAGLHGAIGNALEYVFEQVVKQNQLTL